MSHVRRAAELAIEIDPKLVQAHVNLISLYGRLGQVATAETHFRSSLSLDPKQADALHPPSYRIRRYRGVGNPVLVLPDPTKGR